MQQLKNIFKVVNSESPILFRIVIILFLGAIASLIALFIDNRTLMGINVWIKPLKFFISTAMYTLTVGFLITFYPYPNFKKHIIRNLVSWTLLFELVIISIQAARGVQSHFNTSNALDGSLFGIMGILIAINVLIMVWFAVDTLRLKLLVPRVIQWSFLLGWLITIFGSWVGGQMISQMAHNVGVADGGEGIPLLNWSTVAGDLRVAHFFGLHSIQILPIIGWLISKHWKVKASKQIVLIVFIGIGLAGFIGFTFYQATQGQPFIKTGQ